MNKRKRPLYYLLIAFLAILFTSKIAVAQSIPPFSMQLTNGKSFTVKDLSQKKPVIIIYFSPDCEHCQKLMNEVFNKIQDFKNAQILLISFFPPDKLKGFENLHQTAKYPNVKVGTEVPVFFFRKYYNLENTPFTALFDKHGKLIISYKKETPVDDLIKHLKALDRA